jgi:hypothetical protein
VTGYSYQSTDTSPQCQMYGHCPGCNCPTNNEPATWYYFYPPEPEDEELKLGPIYEPPYYPKEQPWPRLPRRAAAPSRLASYPQFRRHAMRESRRPPLIEEKEI